MMETYTYAQLHTAMYKLTKTILPTV